MRDNYVFFVIIIVISILNLFQSYYIRNEVSVVFKDVNKIVPVVSNGRAFFSGACIEIPENIEINSHYKMTEPELPKGKD